VTTPAGYHQPPRGSSTHFLPAAQAGSAESARVSAEGAHALELTRVLAQLSRATALLRSRDDEAERQGAAAAGLREALREADERAAVEHAAHATAEVLHARKQLRIVTLGVSGGRSLTGPLRDARRFPSTRWYPVPGVTRTTLGFGIRPSFKNHFLSRRRAKPLTL
jgi:hypothetical protein